MDSFANWLKSPLGRYLIEREQNFFDHVVADIFGYYALQVELPVYDFLRSNRMSWRGSAGLSAGCSLHCDPAHLPLLNHSIDLVALPHVLDFHSHPHQVLREVERVLVAEGRVVITGFNPWSLWGASRLLKRRRGMPWQGNFHSLSRIKDWLALLGLEPTAGRIYCYAPPFASASWREQFDFMEFAGDRWWPVGGAVYCLEAIKRVRSVRLITPGWRVPKPIPVAVAEPARTQTAATPPASKRVGPADS